MTIFSAPYDPCEFSAVDKLLSSGPPVPPPLIMSVARLSKQPPETPCDASLYSGTAEKLLSHRVPGTAADGSLFQATGAPSANPQTMRLRLKTEPAAHSILELTYQWIVELNDFATYRAYQMIVV